MSSILYLIYIVLVSQAALAEYDHNESTSAPPPNFNLTSHDFSLGALLNAYAYPWKMAVPLVKEHPHDLPSNLSSSGLGPIFIGNSGPVNYYVYPAAQEIVTRPSPMTVSRNAIESLVRATAMGISDQSPPADSCLRQTKVPYTTAYGSNCKIVCKAHGFREGFCVDPSTVDCRCIGSTKDPEQIHVLTP